MWQYFFFLFGRYNIHMIITMCFFAVLCSSLLVSSPSGVHVCVTVLGLAGSVPTSLSAVLFWKIINGS